MGLSPVSSSSSASHRPSSVESPAKEIYTSESAFVNGKHESSIEEAKDRTRLPFSLLFSRELISLSSGKSRNTEARSSAQSNRSWKTEKKSQTLHPEIIATHRFPYLQTAPGEPRDPKEAGLTWQLRVDSRFAGQNHVFRSRKSSNIAPICSSFPLADADLPSMERWR